MKNPEKETTSINLFRESKSEKPNVEPQEQEKCPRCAGKYLFNFDTGEIKPSFCKAYKCPVCGKYKKFKLQKAIEKFVSTWDRVRLWTFTFSSNVFYGLNTEERLRLASKVWKTFRDLIRKDILLSRNEKSFTYIKFVELQKNGSPHYHALFDRFIHQPKLNKLWQKAIQYNTDYKGTPGNANVNGGIPKKTAGRYVIKYITKQLEEIDQDINFRRWSKSGRGSIFEKHAVVGDWIFIALNSDRHSVISVIEFALWQRELAKKKENQLFTLQTAEEKPPDDPINEFFEYPFD